MFSKKNKQIAQISTSESQKYIFIFSEQEDLKFIVKSLYPDTQIHIIPTFSSDQKEDEWVKSKITSFRSLNNCCCITWKPKLKHKKFIKKLQKVSSLVHKQFRHFLKYPHLISPTNQETAHLQNCSYDLPNNDRSDIVFFTCNPEAIVKNLSLLQPTHTDIEKADLLIKNYKELGIIQIPGFTSEINMTERKESAVLVVAFEEDMTKHEKQLGWASKLIHKALDENPNQPIYVAVSPETAILTSLISHQELQRITFIDQHDIPSLLTILQKAYLYQNSIGLDLLIHGVCVVVSGTPFYAGWGLTEDCTQQVGREAQHTLSSLVAAYTKQLYAYSNKINGFEPLDKALKKIYPISQTQAFKACLINALHYSRLEAYDLAEHLLQTMLQISPENPYLHGLIAEIQRKQQQPHKAIKHLEMATTLAPNTSSLHYDLAQAYRRAGAYNSHTSMTFEKALKTSVKKNFKHIESYVDYLWEYEGVSAKLIDLLKNMTNSQDCPADLRLKYAAILNEAGFSSKAFYEYKKAIAKEPHCIEKNRYLALKAAVTTIDPSCPGAATHERELYNTLLKTQGDFRKLVLQHKDSLCVVGNSPCATGKGKGAFVDSHDFVIRFNNFSVDYPFAKYYGTKTNVWAKTTRFLEIERRNVKDFDLVLISGSNTYHRSNIGYTFYQECVDQGIPVDIFPSSIAFDVTQKLGALPSAGIVLIAYLYSILGPLDPKSILGFSFTDQTMGEANHYSTGRKQLGYRHNWEAEKKLYETLLKSENTKNNAA